MNQKLDEIVAIGLPYLAAGVIIGFLIVTIKGTHFESLTEATDPDSDNYSDILILMSGPLTAKYKTRGVSWKTVR